MTLPSALNFVEGTTPATPTTGRRKMYPKSDGWYQLNSSGVESSIANGVSSFDGRTGAVLTDRYDGLFVGASKVYSATLEIGSTCERSNGGAAMTDTLPTLAAGDNGWTRHVHNVGTVVAETITFSAGGAAVFPGGATSYVLNFGCRQTFVWTGTKFIFGAGNGNIVKISPGTTPVVSGNLPQFGDTSGRNVGDSGQSVTSILSTASSDATTKANAAQAFAIQRANHTGTQLAATISDFASAALIAAPAVTVSTPDATSNANALTLSGQQLKVGMATASFPGVITAAQFKKVRDGYTDVVNDLGADPTGAVDATSLIQAWITGLTTSGVLFIPAQVRIRVDGQVNVTKEIRVVGAERRTSIIGCGNATNTQFFVTASGVVFENLRFEAGTTAQNLALRSAGYCVDIQSGTNGCGFYKTDVIGHWSGYNLEGQLPFVDDCNIREYGAQAGNGQCIRVNTPGAGGDTIIRRLLTDNGSNITGWAGIRVVNCASLIIESCNIIHATNCLAIVPTGTVPSLKVSNTFFDSSTNGVNFAPPGAGVWYRSEFVNCWFGSNTNAGVLFGSAQFDGIVFTNCDFLGNAIGIDANSGGGNWTLNGGCQIAGSTTAGIRLAASANHFPVIQGNRIRPQLVGGSFGANAVGVIIGAGTYVGLILQGNDITNNTSPLTLGAVTVTAWANYRISDNAGINPRGSVTTPGVPTAGTTVTNTTGFRVTVFALNGATAPAAIVVNGVSVASHNKVVTTGGNSVQLDPGGTIAFTTTTVTSWVWVAN